MNSSDFSSAEVKRFWSHVDITTLFDCWPWKLSTMPKGYGQFQRFTRKPVPKNLRWLTHRVAYTLHHGHCPDDICVCHSCDNPICCNPAHLFLGTKLVNNRDSVEKGRNQHGQRHYKASLSWEQVLHIRQLRHQGCTAKLIAQTVGCKVATARAIYLNKNRQKA